MAEVEIKGLAELQRKLKEMPLDVANRVLKTTLRQAADPTRNAMAVQAPKESGFLSEHFNVKVGKRGELAATAFVGPQGKMYYPNRGDRSKGVATGRHPKHSGAIPVASVARFHEFGTSRMSPKPFMRPAFESTKDVALNIIINGIKDAIARWVK